MTIAAGVLCPDGIVLCADTQETVGMIKRTKPKLVELPLISPGLAAVIVGSTDNAIFLDELVEKIADAIDITDGYLARVRHGVEKAVRKHYGDIWKLYSDAERPQADLLMGIKTIDGLSLLEMNGPNIRNITTYEFIGSGSDLASYKAKHCFTVTLPVDAAASLAAYILEVVKDNNIYCSGPTQMAIIRLDGSVEHKDSDLSSRIGSSLMNWDRWANRIGSMLPFLSLGNKPILDYLQDSNSFLTDALLERALFAIVENRLPGELLTVAQWATHFGAIEKRGALSAKDADVFDKLSEAGKLVQSQKAQVSVELKQQFNDLIKAYNEAREIAMKWHSLVERHQDAKDEQGVLDAKLQELDSAIRAWTATKPMLSDGQLTQSKTDEQKKQ